MMLDPVMLTRCYARKGFLAPSEIAAFRRGIYALYHATPRPMPWRDTPNPYHILVSEIMLQQTQVERVRSKYAEFLSAFPDVGALAGAALAEVLRVWQGLGYNRRAISLKRCAEVVVEQHGGLLPATCAELEKLPGIGSYTARAVAAFAFGEAQPLIETNIRTVFIHLFFHGREGVSDKELLPLVAATLDRDNPRDWYYALMDYGVGLKQQHPNPGRRSRHHVRQSRFEGSNRQQRSHLLRLVMAQPGVTDEELTAALKADGEQVARNLAALEKEGFLEQTATGYRVRGHTEQG